MLLAGIIVPLSFAYPARADGSSVAEALFRDARQAMRSGDYGTACPKLVESERLDPSPGTRLNLARCEEHENRLASAWAHYNAVADEFSESDPRRDLAADRAKALEPRIPRIRILLPHEAGLDPIISLDGMSLGIASVGVLLPVNPGPHVLELQTPAGKTTASVTLSEGEAIAVPLSLPVAPFEKTAPSSAQVVARASAQRTAGWLLAAAGAASFATSLVFGGLVLKEKAAVSSGCVDKRCSAAGFAAGRDGSLFASLSTTTFALGIAAIGGGATLVLTAPGPAASRNAASFVLFRRAF